MAMEEPFPATAQRMAGHLTAVGPQVRAEGTPALVPTLHGPALCPREVHPTCSPGNWVMRFLRRMGETSIHFLGTWPQQDPWLLQSHLNPPGGMAPVDTARCLGLPEMPSAVPLQSCLALPHPCTPAAQFRAKRAPDGKTPPGLLPRRPLRGRVLARPCPLSSRESLKRLPSC